MKRGFHTSSALDRLAHPLDWNGIRDLVRALHWDGDVEAAYGIADMMSEHFRVNFRHHRHGSYGAERASEHFYLWLGIAEVLGTMVAMRSSRRREREAAKERRELGLGPRRPARRARSSSSSSSTSPARAKAGGS